jgi:hypothetical protein
VRTLARLLAAGLVLSVAGPASADPAAPARDPRSVVVLREDCRSSIARQELTLFANGTIRLRHGDPESPQMALHELGHSALESYVVRLRAIDLTEAELSGHGPSGEWTERCVLELDRADGVLERFDYERYSSGSLGLDRVRRLIEDLFDEMKDTLDSSEIPSTYRPVIGDVLERGDGELFEVVSFTLEGKGVELVGVEVPITIYLERDKLREMFRRIVPRQ